MPVLFYYISGQRHTRDNSLSLCDKLLNGITRIERRFFDHGRCNEFKLRLPLVHGPFPSSPPPPRQEWLPLQDSVVSDGGVHAEEQVQDRRPEVHEDGWNRSPRIVRASYFPLAQPGLLYCESVTYIDGLLLIRPPYYFRRL